MVVLALDRPTALALHGARYEFIVEAMPGDDEFSFDLRAIDRKSGRWSSIGSLNHVMSELMNGRFDPDDSYWWDTPWDVPPEECARLVTTSVQLLLDAPSLQRLEQALDEDRAEGEWRAS